MAERGREGKEKEEKKKVVKKKERKPKVKRPGWKVYKTYSISGENQQLERKNKNCPKCGKGVFMGKHKDRLVCGKCRYVEYTGKGQ